jgi:ribosomal protein L6P/L9E
MFLASRSCLISDKSKTRWIGRTELFAGRQNMAVNMKEPEIIKKPFRPPYLKPYLRKWPGLVADSLNSSYWYRPNQETPVTMYRMKSKDHDTVMVSSVDKSKTETRTIENALLDNTRGHSIQILFEGRGVKAYLDPAWPNLKVKLSVGSNPLDFTRVCSQDQDIKCQIDAKNGERLVLWGPSKSRVAKVAMSVFRCTRANPMTAKGSHIAFHAPKLVKKSKKK